MNTQGMQTSIEQVLFMAHGWGYNHRFFDAFLKQLPAHTHKSTLLVCLEAGYFPEQSKAGFLVHMNGQWIHHEPEALQNWMLSHEKIPWLGLGHSLGFSKLLNASTRWNSLLSLHGFTHFVSGEHQPQGTPKRVLGRMIQRAEQNMAEVLHNFHSRCDHTAEWGSLDEQALLADLNSMQTLACADALNTAVANGTNLYAWAGTLDKIVSPQLAQACFGSTLAKQGRGLHTQASEHATFAHTPARYTNTLFTVIGQG